MRRFDDLKVWQRMHALVLELYAETKRFPDNEKYGLTSQLRRAAVSVAANLAEGAKRSTRADFARHVAIAEGSASETDYMILLAEQLGYMDGTIAQRLRMEMEEILRMLGALRHTLNEPQSRMRAIR